MTKFGQSRYLWAVIGLVVLASIYRAWVIQVNGFNLYMDEAYYWGWAQSFEFGYFSKPPMIAWLIMFTSSIFGDSTALAIKSGALIVYPITTLVIYATGRSIFDERTGFWAAVIFLTLPVVAISSIIISTDVLLFLFWSLGIYFFYQALQSDSYASWIKAGLAGGFGLMTKYTMILFPLSALIFLAFTEEYREQLKRPGFYLALLVAIIVFLPNIIWNFQHDFPTVRHTAQISQLDQGLIHPLSMAAFLGEQFFVFGPIFFCTLIYFLIRFRSIWLDKKYRLLICFALPFLSVITLQSLLARAHGNWGAPTYVAATVLVAGFLVRQKRWKLLASGIALNLVLMLVPYHFQQISGALNVQLPVTADPYVRIQGWEEFGDALGPVLKAHPDALLLGSDRPILAQAIYYAKPHPFDAVLWNPERIINNHYAIVTTMDDKIGRNFILVSSESNPVEILDRFDSAEPLPEIRIKRDPYPDTLFHLFYLKGFKGYE